MANFAEEKPNEAAVEAAIDKKAKPKVREKTLADLDLPEPIKEAKLKAQEKLGKEFLTKLANIEVFDEFTEDIFKQLDEMKQNSDIGIIFSIIASRLNFQSYPPSVFL